MSADYKRVIAEVPFVAMTFYVLTFYVPNSRLQAQTNLGEALNPP